MMTKKPILTFQFTHPGRGATEPLHPKVWEFKFQFTHPGRGATDKKILKREGVKFQFTHPGRGATRSRTLAMASFTEFQFTHPGRGATNEESANDSAIVVSIHAPREGCDAETSS